MLKQLLRRFRSFIENGKIHPAIALFIASAYALFYYYDRNYALINSRSQFVFLVFLYFIVPLLVFYVVDISLKFYSKKTMWRSYLLTIFSLSCFFMTLAISLYGFETLKLLLALALGVVLGIILKSQFNKVVVIQGILALTVVPFLIPDLYREITYSKSWMDQSDGIEKANFKIKPNIYLIQPDGYAGFSSLRDTLYGFDNSRFENYLKENQFKIYDNYRSNYYSTLTSNSALFAMKHHYYGNTTLGINPRHNRRNEIVGINPVLRAFKHNGYKTFLMLQEPYLLSNRPRIDFDYCNISLDDISYITRGFSGKTDLKEDTKALILKHKNSANFFFVESMLPSHITTYKNPKTSIENERQLYLERLKASNSWLHDITSFIIDHDPDALVIIAADHGSFVGYNYFRESMKKTENSGLINSIFSSALAIRWPQNKVPMFDSEIKSSVNLFRVVFSYLSDNQTYLNQLQDNSSYMVIRKNAPTGVYRYLNDMGETVFDKL